MTNNKSARAVDQYEQAIQFIQFTVEYEQEVGHPNAEKDARHLEKVRQKLHHQKNKEEAS